MNKPVKEAWTDRLEFIEDVLEEQKNELIKLTNDFIELVQPTTEFEKSNKGKIVKQLMVMKGQLQRAHETSIDFNIT